MAPNRLAYHDANEMQFRMRAVTAGVRVTLALSAASLVYLALSWSGPHRGIILAITLSAALDGLLIGRLPHARLIRSGHHDVLLTGWNGIHVVAAAVLAVLDGGPQSPFVAIFFVSVAFAAVSLPLRAVVGIATADVVALLGVAAATDQWPRALIFWCAGLSVTAAVCATIAGDRWSRSLALQDAKEEMLRRLARVVEYRDNETGEHVERMSTCCAIVARRLGWSPAEAHELQIAATMHDVGKVAVPDSILLKPGPLTAEEREVMQQHTVAGHEMLSGSSSLIIQQAAAIALTHHERWDGAGYPSGLSGENIPVAGRIVAIADVFDALTSDRVYRRAMPLDEALDLVESGRGTQFDPTVVDAFFSALDEILDVRGEDLPAGRRPSLVA
jgi:hypothetical protein